MNPDAAKTVAECFLKAPFEAVLSVPLDYEVVSTEPVTGESLSALLTQHAVSIGGRLSDDLGGVVLLFGEAEAGRFASALRGAEAGAEDTLDDEGRGVLEQAAGPLLSGGAAQLLERAGQAAVEVQAPALQQGGDERAEGLTAFLGAEATALSFTYTTGEGAQCTGAMVFSAALEALAAGAEAKPGTLSEDEMKDILSGFGDAGEAAEAAAAGGAPSNLDMVLDIQLEATARLGRVEMPIGDIMNLGPGSIIEVGHVVDEPVELLINGRLVARGDVVQVDEKFGLRITEVISPQARIESLR